MSEADPLAAARALAPLARERADETERARTLPDDVRDALAESGLPAMLVPASLGGGEVHPARMSEALEELARADGSTSWCAMVAATSGLLAAYLDPAEAARIFTPGTIAGGVFAPLGRAEPAGDAYVVTGRWPFASGARHSRWLMGGVIVSEHGEPRLLDGRPELRMAVFPADEVEIHDTWHVAGLRGTGSDDISIRGVLVPRARTASLITDRPRHQGPLYAFPAFGLLAMGIASVTLGLARGAIDELGELAGSKTPTGSRRRLAERARTQEQVARAEAELASARTFLRAAVDDAWAVAARGEAIPVAARGRLRLAATHATASAAAAVDRMYEAGGGSSIYRASPLQRRFRDVHAATQHAMVAPATWELAGRLLLGLDSDVSQL